MADENTPTPPAETPETPTTGVRTLALPERTNQVTYSQEVVDQVTEALRKAPRGQGVAFDEAQDSITKARTRATVMKALVESSHRLPCHGHAVPSGDKVSKPKYDKKGKQIKRNGQVVTEEVETFIPALTINTTKLKAQEKADADAAAAAVAPTADATPAAA